MRAYRSLSGKYHPDKDTSPEGRRRFQQIQEASDVLSDPVRRQEYDRTLGKDGPRRPVANSVVMRTDGSSSFLTLAEHLKRKGTELKNCDLTGLDLSDISFRGANLHGAKLDSSRFANCDFSDADLTECSARNCHLDGTQFSGAQLVKTVFTGSSMKNCVFFRVCSIIGSTAKEERDRFRDYDSSRKVLDGSVETKATLIKNASMSKCDLRGAVFVPPPRIDKTTTTKQSTLGVEREVPMFIRQWFGKCDIRECSFARSNLHEVDLNGLNLKECSLSGANLHGANLFGADIQQLDLSSCNLIDANLHKVRYCSQTKFPDGYPLPGDARDMDKELAAEEEKKKKLEAQQKDTDFAFTVLAVMVFVIFCLCIFVAAVSGASDRGVSHLPPENEAAPVESEPTIDVRNSERAVPSVAAKPVINSADTSESSNTRDRSTQKPSAKSLAISYPVAEKPIYPPRVMPKWVTQSTAALDAARSGDYDRAIELAHLARKTAPFGQRVALAKQIREWDKKRREQ